MSPADESERRDGFLSRWSRRKREEASEAQQAVAPEAEAGAVVEEPGDDFDLSLLPDIESITAESDITLFFRKGVPDALKNAALRKIWTADASIRDFVAPADFQWDFNAPDGVPGFGPLGTEFDMKSMLRQAVGEPEPEAVPAAQTPSSVARDAQSDGMVAGTESAPAKVDDRPRMPRRFPPNKRRTRFLFRKNRSARMQMSKSKPIPMRNCRFWPESMAVLCQRDAGASLLPAHRKRL